MTQTPTIADYPAHEELRHYLTEGYTSGMSLESDEVEALHNEFTALLESNRRYRTALEEMKCGKENRVDDYYDWDCPICGVNIKNLDEHIDKALTKPINNGE